MGRLRRPVKKRAGRVRKGLPFRLRTLLKMGHVFSEMSEEDFILFAPGKEKRHYGYSLSQVEKRHCREEGLKIGKRRFVHFFVRGDAKADLF